MKVKILIATSDKIYTGHISEYISENHADTMEVSVCNTLKGVCDMLSSRKYDVALMDTSLIKNANTESVQLPMLLLSEHDADELPEQFIRINKHQRISSIVAEVFEQYAKVSGNRRSCGLKANITAVWSPIGGSGKTTVTLAYCASKASEGKDVLFLNLESFSSIPAFFNARGKSISTVFEMLDSGEGNVKMLIQGICCQENGIAYLCPPDNFDDISILSASNILELLTSCAEITEELVIDLSCACDERTRQIFDLASRVLIVTEPTTLAQVKLYQFTTQNDVFETIKEKATIVANKGATLIEPVTDSVISLPLVDATDATIVANALKDYSFAF